LKILTSRLGRFPSRQPPTISASGPNPSRRSRTLHPSPRRHDMRSKHELAGEVGAKDKYCRSRVFCPVIKRTRAKKASSRRTAGRIPKPPDSPSPGPEFFSHGGRFRQVKATEVVRGSHREWWHTRLGKEGAAKKEGEGRTMPLATFKHFYAGL